MLNIFSKLKRNRVIKYKENHKKLSAKKKRSPHNLLKKLDEMYINIQKLSKCLSRLFNADAKTLYETYYI